MPDFSMKIRTWAGRIQKRRSFARSVGLIFLVMSLLVAGCGGSEASHDPDKVNVVTTLYPLYFLAQAIGGEDAHVVNLVPAGVEPHDWTPKSRDLAIASSAQLFLYHGAGLEGWTEQFLQGLPANSQLVRVEVSRGIALIDQDGEFVNDKHAHETHQEHSHDHKSHGHEDDAQEHEHESSGHEHDAHQEHGHDHEVIGEEHAHGGEAHSHAGHVHAGTDPHTWVSPKSAMVLAANIRDAFVQVDGARQSAYEARYHKLIEQLETLDQEYESRLAPHRGKDIVVSHQAFAYLCRDYGLNQVAIMGLSPDAEPRAQDMLKIIRYMKENEIKYIFLEQLVSGGPAEIIASETGASLLVLNPLEGLTPQQERAGEDYLSLMQSNLQNLLQALQ